MRKGLIAALWGVLIPLAAQDDQSRIYRAYLEGRMDLWKEVMDQMEVRLHGGSDPELLYSLIEVRYGYIAYCISVKQRKEAEEVLERAEREVGKLLSMQPDHSRALSLTGAFYGFRVRLNPMKAPVYGKRSIEANDRAIRAGPDEPQAWMEKANIAYYKPAIFGGSKSESVPYYEKAVRLFEQTPGRTRENWLYLNCMVGLAMAYENTGKLRQAESLYKKILEMEPEFRWVREDLYPEFLKNQSGN